MCFGGLTIQYLDRESNKEAKTLGRDVIRFYLDYDPTFIILS